MSKTVFKLWSIRSKNDFGKAQTYSRMNVLLIVTICEKFTTEDFSSFDTPFSRRKFPGACSDPRALGSTAHQISPLSITNQLFREHQVEIAEGHHRVLREFRRTNHLVPPFREPPHNSDHEASQAQYRFCYHRKYLLQHFAYLESTANKGVCQLSALPHNFSSRKGCVPQNKKSSPN
jgi:hypothetical protein